MKAAKFQGRKIVWVLLFDRSIWKTFKGTILAKHETIVRHKSSWEEC